MNRVSRRVWISMGSGLLAALLAVAGCGGSANGIENSAESKDEVVRIPVQAAAVRLGDVAANYEGTATLEPEREATVVARTSGVLLRLHVEEGDVVERGQLLAELDADRHRLEVAQAKAQLDRLYREFERMKELHARQLVSSDQFERARSEYESQKAAFDMADLELSYTSIRAPISGMVSQRLVKAGNWIQNQQPLFEIDDFHPLEARLHVPERELSLLQPGYPVTIRTDSRPGRTFGGRVKRISPVVNPDTGTFEVVAELPNEDAELKPGMFVRARIVYDTRQDVPMIPRAALLTDNGDASVFVVDEGVAKKKEIQAGYDDGESVEVSGGLEPGQVVVTVGQGSLRDGTPVEVIGG